MTWKLFIRFNRTLKTYGARFISQPKLILASSSPYRCELLQRLGVDFSCIVPEVDETRGQNEDGPAIALRLAKAKAMAVAAVHSQAVVIGSDQVLTNAGEILGKPGNHDNARIQLRKMSGNTAIFSTGLCVHNPELKQTESGVVDYKVTFRELTECEIDRYLYAEEPYDCAGSFKSEKLGISLVHHMQGDDPTALVGLPLIELSRMLRNAGFQLP